MKFNLSKAEWNASIKSHLSTIPSDLTTSELYVSGSRWNETHLKALRVAAFDNLSQWQLVPDRWLPHPNLKRSVQRIEGTGPSSGKERSPELVVVNEDKLHGKYVLRILRSVERGKQVKGQDAYVLTIHGTQLRIVAAHFTRDYQNRVQSSTMPIDKHLYVRRSGFYELKDQAGRIEALKVVVGLFRYILNGRTEMAQIRAVANELRKSYG